MSHRMWIGVAIGLLAVGAESADLGVARPEKRRSTRPPEWRDVSAQERLKALSVAEEDANALLAERIYGLEINADTLVLDLVLADEKVMTHLNAFLRGARTVEEKYTEDLIVEVVRKVTLREVIEEVRRTVRRTSNPLRVSVEEISNISTRTKDIDVAVMGNGAVPGSKGLRMIRAKRAAEVNAYRKLAARVVGMQINRETVVKDFILESDRIATHVAAILKGAKPVRIVYDEDDLSCEVTMRLALREVVKTLRRAARRHARGRRITETDWRRVETEQRDKVVVETGRGAPRHEEAVSPVTPMTGTSPFYEETEVVRTVAKLESSDTRQE